MVEGLNASREYSISVSTILEELSIMPCGQCALSVLRVCRFKWSRDVATSVSPSTTLDVGQRHAAERRGSRPWYQRMKV